MKIINNQFQSKLNELFGVGNGKSYSDLKLIDYISKIYERLSINKHIPPIPKSGRDRIMYLVNYYGFIENSIDKDAIVEYTFISDHFSYAIAYIEEEINREVWKLDTEVRKKVSEEIEEKHKQINNNPNYIP